MHRTGIQRILTSLMVSRTAARAASLSTLDIPVFSAILDTNSGLRKVSTSDAAFFAFTGAFVFTAFFFLVTFFLLLVSPSAESASALMAVDLREEIKALRGRDWIDVVNASATLAIKATRQIIEWSFIVSLIMRWFVAYYVLEN